MTGRLRDGCDSNVLGVGIFVTWAELRLLSGLPPWDLWLGPSHNMALVARVLTDPGGSCRVIVTFTTFCLLQKSLRTAPIQWEEKLDCIP